MSKDGEQVSERTVLFVEDEPLIRMVGVELLSDAGYEVLEAADAGEAMHILEDSCEVQVLVTDIRRPGSMSGLELAAAVHDRWPRSKLLLTSGDTMLADSQIPDSGHFLSKPYQAEDLRREVRTLLASY